MTCLFDIAGLVVTVRGLIVTYPYSELVIFENNRLTIGTYSNTIQNLYKLLLTEFRYTLDDSAGLTVIYLGDVEGVSSDVPW